METLRMGLSIAQVILSIFLIVVVLLQQSQRSGLSGAISGNTDTFFSKNKSRSKEKRLSNATVIGFVLFVLVSLSLNIFG